MASQDEQRPLLEDIVDDAAVESTFASFKEHDPKNPREWTSSFKWFVLWILAFCAFTVTWTCIMVAPIARQIIDELSPGGSTKSAKVLLVSIWEIGEAAGPLLIAPLSEYFGRKPVINVCSVVAVIATVISCTAPTTNVLIMGRLLSGAMVTVNVLNPAIIGDILAPEERGTAMSLMLLAPLAGGTFGPAFAGFAAERWHWRFAMLTSVVIVAAASVTLFLTFKETYGPAILKKRAAKAASTGQPIVTEADAVENADSEKAKLLDAVFRPAKLLYGSGILLVLSLYTAVAFSYIYVVAVAVPEIVEGIYGLSATHTGFIFVANGIGSIFGILAARATLDPIYIRLKAANNGVGKPEFRLPMAIVGCLILGPCIMVFGWSASLRWPLWVGVTTMVIMRVGMLLSFVPIHAYVVDAFGLFAASAMTAVIVLRCLGAAFLPLLTEYWAGQYGYGLSFTMCGTFTICSLVVPLTIFYKGEKWRQRCKYSMSA